MAPRLAGAPGIFSGFDVDAIFIDEDGDLATAVDRFFASSFLFTAGTTRPTNNPRFLPVNGNPAGQTFGSLDANTIDLAIATLHDLDAFFESGISGAAEASGVLTLVDGGTLIANFSPAVPIEGTLFILIAEVGGQPGEEVGASVIVSTEAFVLIDVMPGRDPNSIAHEDLALDDDNDEACDDDTRLRVAVLTSDIFDALLVNAETVELGEPVLGGTAEPLQSQAEDVDGDGDQELLVVFSICDLVVAGALGVNSTELVLRGETTDGTPIIGSDSVLVVQGDDDDDDDDD